MPINSISWLAGYLEGEGTFLAPPPSNSSLYRVRVTATDEDVVAHVAATFGSQLVTIKNQRKEHWSTIYEATSRGRYAIAWMQRLYPYMGQRRQEKIELVLGYKPTTTADNVNEREWLIGLLEGEGSFMKGPPSEPNKPRIQVQMTDLDVLERAAPLLYSKVLGPFKRKNENAKLQYAVKIRGKKAADLMKEMRPHMGIRRQQQIDAALENFEYRYGFGSTHSRAKLTEDDVRYIKRELAKGIKGTGSRLAREFNLDPKNITWIKQGKTWGHVTLDDSDV